MEHPLLSPIFDGDHLLNLNRYSLFSGLEDDEADEKGSPDFSRTWRLSLKQLLLPSLLFLIHRSKYRLAILPTRERAAQGMGYYGRMVLSCPNRSRGCQKEYTEIGGLKCHLT